MLKSRILKSLLIPTLGISTIGTIAAVSTSCGNAIHVTSVSLNEPSTILDVDGTEQLTATVLPENATDKLVTWTSSNPSVATVDSNGKITAVAEGTANITVKTNDGGKTAFCQVTVQKNECTVITANEDSILELWNAGGNDPNLQYSTDNTNWTTYSEPINIIQGQRLYLKGNNPEGWSKLQVYSSLSITGNVSISGNIMGLLDNGAKPGEQGDITDIPCDYCFYYLFENSTGIKNVSEDFLPATTLAEGCYAYMFYSCTKLEKAPKLPAISLIKSCYFEMFENCSSITTAPALPAITLANYCYSYMFQGCTSLTTAPELPAMNLTDNCYFSMFQGCTSLTTAPELPAKTLANNCYWSMFYDCTSLNSIKIGYTGNYFNTYFNNWVSEVASSGAFYYNGSQTAQDFGFPGGWTTRPY